jgi:hypothetical protein
MITFHWLGVPELHYIWRDDACIGRLTKMADRRWYYVMTDDPYVGHYAGRTFNAAKRTVRERFAR